MDKNDLAGKARRLKTDSSNLLDRARKDQKTLEGINPEFEQVNSRVGDIQNRKNSIQRELATFQNDLQRINRDDIDNVITSAKNMAQNAKDVTANVLEELEPIKTDVENIKNTYGSMHSADFSAALVEANNSVTNLTNILPDLFNKITSINEQLMPIGNISENLNRIRELIQQARDAANKVAIPMRFNGSAGVEVRPPSILEDLKGYTSLSLFLQRPTSRLDTPRTSNMFVMYLGNKDSSKDYIGMAVRRSRLICAYSLGGNEAEIEVSEPVYQSETKDAILDHVKFERIYQYAKLNYIKGATSSSASSLGPFNGNSGSSHTLLNLDPENVVFYVGGYPEDFIPPSTLDFPRYEGCIELDSLNERVISLYNFKRTFNLNTTEVQPCRRYTEQSAKTYFEGTGYAHVTTTLPSTPSSSVRYEQTIQTTADEGLVFLAENQDEFLSLSIEKGNLVISYKVGSQPPNERRTKEVVNNGMDQPIGIVIVQKKIVLVLKSAQHLEIDNVALFRFDSYYLGGLPTSLRERFNISTPPFRGCMMNWRTSFDASPVFSDTLGVSRKCSDDWKLVRTATFFKNGLLDLSDDDFPFPNDFQVGFGFYTLVLDGTLLNYNLRPDILSVLLRNGFIIVRLADEEHQSSKKYEAGSMHYVTLIKQGDILRLLVDDVPESTIEGTFGRKTSSRPIQMGGNNFEGCISNVFIQRTGHSPQVQNLTSYTSKTEVSLGSCMIKKPPQPMLLKESTNTYHLKILKKKAPTIYLTAASEKQNTDNCPSGAPLNFVTGAYHFGNTPGTHLLFTTSQISPRDRSHFAIDVRTSLSGGLIFFMGDMLQSSYVSLYLSKGRFIISLAAENGRKIKIKSKAKYSDGQWHNVVFSIIEKRTRLVIDGLRTQEDIIQPNYSASNELPIYLGGVPSLRLKNVPKKSFVGCLRNFNVGGKFIPIHNQNKGILPCLNNTLENGASFFSEGGHIVIENSFEISLEYTIVFNIRPRSLTGILIHTGNKRRNYLTVYMERGTFTASGNNGAGEFSMSVTPQQPLCDGKWHTISVTQKQNIVHLNVDSKSNYTSVPSTILSTRPAQPLYFGRVPVNLKTPWLPVQDVFLGCLKDVKINEKPRLVNKMSDIHGIVSLHGCPVN